LHAPIAVRAMEHDKHMYTELPVATTIEECWQVVETSERTRKHCYMGCGSCHDGTSAVLLNMVRQGFFGELIHGEGHYIHDRVSDNNSNSV
jgi:predicted dehydrogenase